MAIFGLGLGIQQDAIIINGTIAVDDTKPLILINSQSDEIKIKDSQGRLKVKDSDDLISVGSGSSKIKVDD